jgi:hypothetical protein
MTMKLAASVRAFAITLVLFLLAFFAVRLGLVSGLGSDAWLNDKALAGTIADIEARREQVMTQLSLYIAGVMVVGVLASLGWIVWWSANAGTVARPDRSSDGRPLWTVLAIAIAIAAAGSCAQFVSETVAGNYLSDNARTIIALALITVPLVLYWFVSCITTPNVYKVSVPLSGWAIWGGGR